MPLSIRFPHSLVAVLCASILLCTGTRAEAATFCVGTAVELQTALNLAAHNQQDDAIRLRQGVYSAATPASAEADFHLAAMDGLSLSITGGWTAGCASRQRAVGTTRLQAGAGRRAMGLVFPNSSASNVGAFAAASSTLICMHTFKQVGTNTPIVVVRCNDTHTG